ncbi:hypothetical protein [Pseudalkalibacillus berkeleyi]|uniref:Uncharacterized protein n=1 Tax=Pseudalkalibacillus berkeleyi TaxID=1069813 RepID=A0ABS9GUU0_9BACL|nr:hypothetical protein [Pseudalkalibacillus berkeleyi]MCF6136449.1 hypothetical protein [Pseudalkalibacillus berkeleyi]
MAENNKSLTPEAFKVNENGKVIVNDARLIDLIRASVDEANTGKRGIAPDLSIKP